MMSLRNALAAVAMFGAAAGILAVAQAQDGAVSTTGYHLTARPWKPLEIPREKYLDAIEGICRFSVQHQGEYSNRIKHRWVGEVERVPWA